jgi:site-specific DNA recombinase
VPLGYAAVDKKLIENPHEAETVRYIFNKYLQLKSFGPLVQDLDRRGIVTKRRDVKVRKYQGGIPFTYGPLAHVLKNRIYIGEIGHDGKWFDGEHKAIIDRTTFDRVQDLLASNTSDRKVKRFESGAPLMGKIHDDRGNRMSPSYSVKNGVRYRFYISSALLRGRKEAAGSAPRVPAQEIETAIENALRCQIQNLDESRTTASLFETFRRIVVRDDSIVITTQAENADYEAPPNSIKVPWQAISKLGRTHVPANPKGSLPAQHLLQSIVRAYTWMNALANGQYASIEDLAKAVEIHPKVTRLNLRLAFLAPSIVQAIIEDQRAEEISLSTIPNKLPGALP